MHHLSESFVYFENGKTNALTTSHIPKVICQTDGKKYPVYEVKAGQITIKGNQYPVNLADGFYMIRKLTVSECKRLQTVPEWFVFPVSDTQAYKCLGNGWTCDVITHLINSTQTASRKKWLDDLLGGCP